MTLDQIVDTAVDMLCDDGAPAEERALLRAVVADAYRRRGWDPAELAKLAPKEVRPALRAGMRRRRSMDVVVTARPEQVSPKGKGYVPTVGEWVQ